MVEEHKREAMLSLQFILAESFLCGQAFSTLSKKVLSTARDTLDWISLNLIKTHQKKPNRAEYET